MALSKEIVIDRIQRRLGAPVIEIELDTTNYEEVIKQALDVFSQYDPLPQVETVKIQSQGVSVVEFPVRTIPEFNEDVAATGVLDVQFYRRGSSFEDKDIEVALMQNPWTFISRGFPAVDIFDWELKRQWIEILQFSFANVPDFYVDSAGNQLFIIVPQAMDVTVTWAMPLIDVSDVPGAREHLFISLCEAISRQILGQIRNKFQGVPAAGTVVQLDGAYQLDRGMQDYKEIIDKLQRSPKWMMARRGA